MAVGPATAMTEVALGSGDVGRLEPYLGPAAAARLAAGRTHAKETLVGRRVWAISSTASGGGVAEMMRALLPYLRGVGIDVRWMVITGPADFFRVTKRVHNWLHGHPGDRGRLGAGEFALLRRAAARQAEALQDRVAPGDVVVLHDPQTAFLVEPLKHFGANVVWRCHVGADPPNARVAEAWDWLLPCVAGADRLVFTRPGFVPPALRGDSTRIITPAIDPTSVKNQHLPLPLAQAIGQQIGVLDGRPARETTVACADGAVVRVVRRARTFSAGPLPRAGIDPLVLSVCRWDRLKDQVGIISAFVEHVLPQRDDAHLLVAGPPVGAIQDDPESSEVFELVHATWTRLPAAQRRQVTLACLPFESPDENAAIVNALQTFADLVVKKSLQEGLGLAVTEALWKQRPVVATRIGGHRDQIHNGRHGLLVDPSDLPAFGNAVVRLLDSPRLATRLARAGHRRVQQRFLADRYFLEWTQLLGELPGHQPQTPLTARHAARRTQAGRPPAVEGGGRTLP